LSAGIGQRFSGVMGEGSAGGTSKPVGEGRKVVVVARGGAGPHS